MWMACFHNNTHANTHVCTHTCIHTHTHLHAHTEACTHRHAHAHRCTHIHTYIHICTDTQIDVHTDTCIHTHTHMHVLMSIFKKRVWRDNDSLGKGSCFQAWEPDSGPRTYMVERAKWHPQVLLRPLRSHWARHTLSPYWHTHKVKSFRTLLRSLKPIKTDGYLSIRINEWVDT